MMKRAIRELLKRLPGTVVAGAATMLLAGGAYGEFTPAAVNNTVTPRFPLDAAVDGLRQGSATILLEIDSDGRLNDWLPLSATHRGFVSVLGEVIEQWTFQPAMRDGEPVRSNLPLNVQFRSDGLLTSISRMQVASDIMSIPFGEKEEAPLVAPLKELDRAPKVQQSVSPVYPAHMVDAAKQPAVFSLYIDTEGRVRLPTLTQSSGNALLDLSAYDALLQWRFEAPTMRGKPVVATAEQAFRFEE